MRLGKKVAAIAIAGTMIVGHSIAALAALAGFTVTNPSLTTLNGKYVVSGGVSYNSSGTYYLQDVVNSYSLKSDGTYTQLQTKAGYGYNAASAMTDGTSSKPNRIENVGSYKSGASFTIIERKTKDY